MALTKATNRMISGAWSNVVDFGADNTGTTSCNSAFTSADAVGNRIIIPNGTYKFDADITLNNQLVFDDGAVLLPDSGKTVTINGTVHSGNERIFGGDGTVKLGASSGGTQEIIISWYADSGVGSNSSKWKNAFYNAYSNNSGVNHTYRLPPGQYEEDNATIVGEDSDRVDIRGAGKEKTHIYISSTYTGTGAFWQFIDTGNVVGLYGISGISFHGRDTVTVGRCLELVDIDSFHIEDILIEDWNGDVNATAIKVMGRQLFRLEKSRIRATTIGVHLDGNPNHTTIDCDTFIIRDIFIFCGDTTNGYCIKITADGVFNCLFENINMGTALYGIHVNNSAGFSCYNNIFRNIRIEQMNTSTGWCMHLNPGDTWNTTLLENVRMHTACNGLYARNQGEWKMSNCELPTQSGKTCLDILNYGTMSLTQIACDFGSSATFDYNSMTQVTLIPTGYDTHPALAVYKT
jgi:hypothetical protein